LSPKAAQIQNDAGLILDGMRPDSATLSLDVWATQSSIFLTLLYLLVFMLAVLLVNTRARLKLLLWTLVLSGLLQSLYGIVMTLSGVEQIFFYEKISGRGLVTGTYINRNHLAGYLVMTLSLGIGLMLGLLDDRRRTGWRNVLRSWIAVLLGGRFILRFFLVIMVIGLVMTHSRMGNASFFIAMLVSAIVALFIMRRARRGMLTLIVSLIVIDIVIIGAWFGLDKVVDRLQDTIVVHPEGEAETIPQPAFIREGQIEINDEGRRKLHRDIRPYWKDYWLTGSGLGSFRHVFPAYKDEGLPRYYEHAHQDYYEFAVEAGLPGILMLLVLFCYPFAVALSAMRKRKDKLMQGLSFGVVMSIMALVMHSTVDFNLQIPANALTFTVVLALAFIAAYMPTSGRQA